jgi:hypothetical protein
MTVIDRNRRTAGAHFRTAGDYRGTGAREHVTTVPGGFTPA